MKALGHLVHMPGISDRVCLRLDGRITFDRPTAEMTIVGLLKLVGAK